MPALRYSNYRSAQLIRLQCVLWALLVTLFSSQTAAYLAGQRVLDAPNGQEIGVIRATDSVEILNIDNVYRQGKNERWAFVEYGDSYSAGSGWINMGEAQEKLRDQKQQREQQRNAAPQRAPGHRPARPPAASSVQTDIQDMDIACHENSRGYIQGCRLNVKVDVKPTAGSGGSARVSCAAELHWTEAGGRTSVSGDQAERSVDLYQGKTRSEVELSYDFGAVGATEAMVENQQCSVSTEPTYNDPYESEYRY